MKKTLLLASATVVCMLASAQTALQPQVIAGESLARISPNGEWISNNDVNFGVISLTNLKTGEKYIYESNEDENLLFTAGLGNSLSNNGIVLGTSDISGNIAGYGENGVWHNLPVKPEDKGMCSAHGISADGKVICGNVGGVAFGADDGSIMVHPVVWTRQEDGTFALYQDLPYPTKDFLGATPQYVTAVCVSADGKTIAGQMMSNSGMYIEPVLYTQAADGTWSYTLVNNQAIFNPNNVEYPEYPSDQPEYPNMKDYATAEEIAACDAALEAYNEYQAKQPMMTDYMTDEEKAAYQAALDNYDGTTPYPSPEEYMTSEELEAYNAAVEEFWANYPEYPSLTNFMTEEEVAAYQEAENEYNIAINEWYQKFDEYQATLDELTADVPHFIFNTIALSDNGRYMILSDQKPAMFWGESSDNAVPYVFDLEEGTYKVLDQDFETLDLLVCYVGNNGQILAASPTGSRLRNIYLCKDWKNGNGFTALYDIVKDEDPTLYSWMNDNMRHTYETDELDYETWEVITVEHVDEWLTGTPYSTPDLDFIVTWVDNVWDYEAMDEGFWTFSYILPMDNVDGQASITTSDLGVKAMCGGKIAFKGNVKSVVVYDINGREVYSANAPGAEVSTGLGQGFYLIKATDANGNTATAKAAF